MRVRVALVLSLLVAVQLLPVPGGAAVESPVVSRVGGRVDGGGVVGVSAVSMPGDLPVEVQGDAGSAPVDAFRPNPESLKPGWRTGVFEIAVPDGGGEVRVSGSPVRLVAPAGLVPSGSTARVEVFDRGAVGSVSPFGAAVSVGFRDAATQLSPTGRSGSYGWAISNLAYGWESAEPVPVIAGASYEVGGWVRGEIDAAESFGAWIVRASFLDAGGEVTGHVDVARGDPGSLSDRWERVGDQVTIPDGVVSVRVELFNYLNGGWVAFDDTTVSAVSDASVSTTYGFGSGAVAVGVDADVSYTFGDHLGSVVAAYRRSDGRVSRRFFLPYGQVRASDTMPTDRSFTGQHADATGLLYLHARYLDPTIGRFIQPDVLIPDVAAPQSLNRYSYVLDDPINHTDPTGRQGWPVGERDPQIETRDCRGSGGCGLLVVGVHGGFGWARVAYIGALRRTAVSRVAAAAGVMVAGAVAVEVAPALAALVPDAAGAVSAAVDNALIRILARSTVATAQATGWIRHLLGADTTTIEEQTLATNTADDLLALPGRQVDATWGVNTYRHGGTMTTIEHINYRHAWDTGFSNVSRFAEGTSARQIQGLVDDALKYGTVSGNGTSVLWDAGRALGVDAAGNTATGVQVYIRDGIIQTAFPVGVP
ncbi:MAG: RHS repeat-associated core domain-containing protein [Actinobacteria bacterium]|nr:RHS repeat-associated core domain-containing protein [Actinomycetota bacterium]